MGLTILERGFQTAWKFGKTWFEVLFDYGFEIGVFYLYSIPYKDYRPHVFKTFYIPSLSYPYEYTIKM